MRVALFSFGSRGDSEPLAALALELERRGHSASLVTDVREHLRLGFEARLWDDAFPLLLAAKDARQRVGGRFRRYGLLHLPALAWMVALLVVHVASIPLMLLSASGRRARAGMALDGIPSLVDRAMLGDAILRPEWKRRVSRNRWETARWLGPLLDRYPVPGRLVDFADARLEGADLVVIGEGADDPARERLLLWLAGRRGIPCVAARVFPRAAPPGAAGYPSWLTLSCFPWLLPAWSPGSPLRDRLSHLVARLLVAVLQVHSLAYGIWYALIDRWVLRSPPQIRLFDDWLAARGEPATDWASVMRADYASSLRAWPGEPVLPEAPGGYWPLPPPEGWQPPETLAAFLDAGEPVVWVSRVAHSRGVQEALAGALEAVPGCRLLINLSPRHSRAGLGEHPRVHFVESVPHEWLLPRVAAAVHHGGVGTTAAALRAALPTVVFPTWGDQTLWAQRVHVLGVGPRPLHVRWVEPVGLARCLRALLGDAGYRERAASVAAAMRAAPGAEAAASALEELAAQLPVSAPVEDRAVVQ